MGTELSVAETLREAVKVLDERGWVQGHLTCVSGSCALGAIAIVRGYLQAGLSDEQVYEQLETDPVVVLLSDSIYREFAGNTYITVGLEDTSNTSRVYRWNDSWIDNKEDVKARFLALADKAESTDVS